MDKVKKAQIDSHLLERYQNIVGKPLHPQHPAQIPQKTTIVRPAIKKAILQPEEGAVTFTPTSLHPELKGKTIEISKIYIIGGILFFAIYTAIWIVLFHIKLPF